MQIPLFLKLSIRVEANAKVSYNVKDMIWPIITKEELGLGVKERILYAYFKSIIKV